MSTRNDLFYVASLIEYIGRKTFNHLRDVAMSIGEEGIAELFKNACVNHCLSFEQVADETIEQYRIANGTFEPAKHSSFRIPTHTEIGRVYTRLVEDVEVDTKKYPERLFAVLISPVSDAISDVRTSFFFASRGEIKYFYQSYLEGKVRHNGA